MYVPSDILRTSGFILQPCYANCNGTIISSNFMNFKRVLIISYMLQTEFLKYVANRIQLGVEQSRVRHCQRVNQALPMCACMFRIYKGFILNIDTVNRDGCYLYLSTYEWFAK